MDGLELASAVSTKTAYEKVTQFKNPYRCLDYGIKQHIVECMVSRGHL
jgi:carbamoylphosphate synthase small subunit